MVLTGDRNELPANDDWSSTCARYRPCAPVLVYQLTVCATL